ncbi:nuclease-related domain-containing protein [Tetragenococcus halophilus]|uniref:nuclease-related domain-containing protein n=1 Tax=Tetragenococcus halophilus TaxID=51669 RepID=UPI000B9292AB|nr:nuclease-related domain-containing protein [Tetragenococcus halophilus]MCO7026745.1 NERD domain-containing protein [Tetragenococcus halophilus]MCO8287196.1 NERD domain-containing protein [Tetragenococcus halophilus]GBD60519.1 putative uncharacterized protein [Tetragenococcus halophilus subsp. halophilus]
MRKKPHDLQWLETLSKRKQLNEEQRWALQRSQKGFLGERQMDKLVETFLPEITAIINDITLKYQSTVVQIDKILLVGTIVYIIDMKFYQGNYTFQNNSWQRNGKKLPTNILEQLRRAVRVIENIFKENQIDLKVKGVLAFLNPESNIYVEDTVPEKVLAFNELPLWLLELKKYSSDEHYLHWQSVLFQYQINGYRTKRQLTLEEEKHLQKGICCPHCHQFNTWQNKHTVHCECGYIETKEVAYVRTICEFGVIFHNRNLRLGKLKEFFGEQVEPEYLRYILKKHFVSVKHTPNRKLGHENKGIVFEYWFADRLDYFNQLDKRKFWKRANI